MVSNDRLIGTAKLVAGLAKKFGLTNKAMPQASASQIDILDLYYSLVKNPELRKHTEKRFINGHYQDAVLEAYKYLNNYVKLRVQNSTIDGLA
jgi:hypothetical protein